MRIQIILAIAIGAMAPAQPAAADHKAALLKRGTYLMNGPVACANCHSPRGPDLAFLPGMDFAGGFKIVDPAFEVYAANITQHKDAGIAAARFPLTDIVRVSAAVP